METPTQMGVTTSSVWIPRCASSPPGPLQQSLTLRRTVPKDTFGRVLREKDFRGRLCGKWKTDSVR